MTASKGKLEVFELIAQDPSTDSYLARWSGATWVVLRRARDEQAAQGMRTVGPIVFGLTHPNVVRTFDPSAELPELSGVVLLEEYVEGERLADWMPHLHEEPLPWQVACAIVRDAAVGAQAIQRATPDPRAASELCPQRLAVGFDGSVRIVDPCAELRGAPMAEADRARYCESAAAVDASAAAYALGRMLSELLPAASAENGVPKPLERILQRAASGVEVRYRTAAELAAALDALLDDPEPVRAYFAERFAEQRRAHTDALRAITDELPAQIESGFTDEIKTAVIPRAVPDSTETMRALPDFEESNDTEQLKIDEVLGAFAADEDEDLRTRPFRREVLSKLKRNEQETLARGGARVAVVSRPLQPARTVSHTPDENVIVAAPSGSVVGFDLEAHSDSVPPVGAVGSDETPLVPAAVVRRALAAQAGAPTERAASVGRAASRKEPARVSAKSSSATEPRKSASRAPALDSMHAGETVLIRVPQSRPRARDLVILAIVVVIVLGFALWVLTE